jgi:hypothetical protein
VLVSLAYIYNMRDGGGMCNLITYMNNNIIDCVYYALKNDII